MITLDRGDSHYADAGGWIEACYHLGVFLRWAMRRGLAAASHVERAEMLIAAPGAYVVKACDGKLSLDDFATDEWLIRSLYGRFLPRYGRLVHAAVGTEYVGGLDDALVAQIERELDRDLRRLRPESVRSSEATPAEVPSTAATSDDAHATQRTPREATVDAHPADATAVDTSELPSTTSPSRRRVRHPKFGVGEVVATWREGGREKVTVEFEGVGRKTLLASFVDTVES